LELSDDVRLTIVKSSVGYVNVKDYGSAADDRDAYKSFLGFSLSEEQTPEALAALIVGSSAVLGVRGCSSHLAFPIVDLWKLYQ
jgi:hypothetical protein